MPLPARGIPLSASKQGRKGGQIGHSLSLNGPRHCLQPTLQLLLLLLLKHFISSILHLEVSTRELEPLAAQFL